jgi:hypothetical protein
MKIGRLDIHRNAVPCSVRRPKRLHLSRGATVTAICFPARFQIYWERRA